MSTEIHSIIGSKVWRRLDCPNNHRLTIQNSSISSESWGEIFIGVKTPTNAESGFRLVHGVETNFNVFHDNVVYVRGQFSPMLTYMYTPLDPADIGEYTSTPTTMVSLTSVVHQVSVPAKHTVLFQQLSGSTGEKIYVSFDTPITVVNNTVTSPAYILSYLQFMAITLEDTSNMYFYGPGLKIAYKIDPSMNSIPDQIINRLILVESDIADLKEHKVDEELFENTVDTINKYIADSVKMLDDKKVDKTTYNTQIGVINEELIRLESDKADRGHNHADLDIQIENINTTLESKVDKTTTVTVGFGMNGGGSLEGNIEIGLFVSSQFQLSPSEGLKLLVEDSLNNPSPFTPLSANQGSLLNAAINLHSEDNTKHITAAERLDWNTKISNLTTVTNTIMGVTGQFKINLDGSYYDITSSNNRFVKFSDVVDNTTSMTTNTPLSANQGRLITDNINTHKSNIEAHVQPSERTLWNGYNTSKVSVTTYDSDRGSMLSTIDTINARLDNSETTGSGTVSDLNLHKNNTTVHISESERVSWNAKVNTSDVVNHLTSFEINKPLSAAMGRELALRIPDSSTIGDHLSDQVIHITTSERNSWNSSIKPANIVNHLNSTGTDIPLSANMGKVLNESKVEVSVFSAHDSDDKHITNEERALWNNTVLNPDFVIHENSDIHVDSSDRTRWDDKIGSIDFATHAADPIHIDGSERNKWNTALYPLSVVDNLSSIETQLPLSANMGRELDGKKASKVELGTHLADVNVHVTPENRESWDSKVSQEMLESHTADMSVHTTSMEKQIINDRLTTIERDAYMNGSNSINISGYNMIILGPNEAVFKTHDCSTFTIKLTPDPEDDFIVNWGDGTINSELSHTYNESSVYIVKIMGKIIMNEDDIKNQSDIQTVVDEYMPIRENVKYAIEFRGSMLDALSGSLCSKISAPIFESSPTVSDYTACFKDSFLLESIESHIFGVDTNQIMVIRNMFEGCSSLVIDRKIIPSESTAEWDISDCYLDGPITNTEGDSQLFNLDKCIGESMISGYVDLGVHIKLNNGHFLKFNY